MDSKSNRHAVAVLASKHVTQVKDSITVNLRSSRISTTVLSLEFGEESSLSHQELHIIGIRGISLNCNDCYSLFSNLYAGIDRNDIVLGIVQYRLLIQLV